MYPFPTDGTTYLLYEKEAGTENNAWNFSSIGGTGLVAASQDGGPYSTSTGTQGTFSVR